MARISDSRFHTQRFARRSKYGAVEFLIEYPYPFSDERNAVAVDRTRDCSELAKLAYKIG